ncbi:MAG: PPOX class F420-dependent oxidoreductase [Candidatus Dormibacteria bacterium]
MRDFLAVPNLAAAATLGPDGAPQATVVWFLLEGEQVLINTKVGRSKVRNLDRDPRVALAIFDQAEPYRSVQVRGRAAARRQGDAAAEDIHRLSRRYTGHDYRDPDARITYLITVESWTSYGLPEVG